MLYLRFSDDSCFQRNTTHQQNSSAKRTGKFKNAITSSEDEVVADVLVVFRYQGLRSMVCRPR